MEWLLVPLNEEGFVSKCSSEIFKKITKIKCQQRVLNLVFLQGNRVFEDNLLPKDTAFEREY